MTLWYPDTDINCCEIIEENTPEDVAGSALLWLLKYS